MTIFVRGANVTVETFCTSGQAERFKGTVHAAAGTIVGAMAVYNAVAWCYRRERHLGINAILYGLGFAWEAYQTSRHFRRPTHPRINVVSMPPRAGAPFCTYDDVGLVDSENATRRAG